MSDNGRFSEPSSFADEPELDSWPEGVRRVSADDPLYEELMAAVYGYVLNGKRYRIGADNEPEVVEESEAPPIAGLEPLNKSLGWGR